MPGLIDVRDAAVALLRAALPEVRRIEAFSGEFTPGAATLKNLPPEAVFVAALSGRNPAAADSLDFDMLGAFCVFVLTRARASREACEGDGLALAERAALALHGGTFSIAGVGPARVLGLEPAYDEELEKSGVMIWTVLWQQPLVFTGPQTSPEAARASA